VSRSALRELIFHEGKGNMDAALQRAYSTAGDNETYRGWVTELESRNFLESNSDA